MPSVTTLKQLNKCSLLGDALHAFGKSDSMQPAHWSECSFQFDLQPMTGQLQSAAALRFAAYWRATAADEPLQASVKLQHLPTSAGMRTRDGHVPIFADAHHMRINAREPHQIIKQISFF